MITKSKLVNIALVYSRSNVQDEMRKLFQSYQNGEIVELRNQVDFKYETFSMYTMALNTENNAYDELKKLNKAFSLLLIGLVFLEHILHLLLHQVLFQNHYHH